MDRSAAYMARYVAKNIVAAGLAKECEIQLSYAIGVPRPTSIHLECFGTEHAPLATIVEKVREHFTLTPRGIITSLGLNKPIYRPTAAGGHFGREAEGDFFPWEKTDKVELLKA